MNISYAIDENDQFHQPTKIQQCIWDRSAVNFDYCQQAIIIDYRKSRMIPQQRIDQAIRELGIKSNNGHADKEQLSKILFEILAFPMVEDAQIHQQANKLGQQDLKRHKRQLEQQLRSHSVRISEIKVCPCCGNLQQQQNLSCCQPLQEVDLGVGVRLYFMSLAHHAIILTVGLFLYAIYSLVTNIVSANNEGLISDSGLCFVFGNCGVAILSSGSKAVLQTQAATSQVVIQMILGIVFIAFWGAILFLRLHKERKMEIQMQTERISAADFTLMISNFPKVYLNKPYVEVFKEIQRIFRDYEKASGTIHTYEIVKVNVARPLYAQLKENMERRQQLKQQMKKKMSVFRRWIQYRRQHREFPIPADAREQFYEDYVNFFTGKYDQKQVHEVALDDKNLIFVTMRSSVAREEIVRRNQWRLCGGSEAQFPIREVTIEQAPEPEQIVWENVGFPFWPKLGRKVFIYFISLVFLGISFGITVGITYVQITDNANLAILVSLIITAINFVIEYTIYLISYLENQVSKTTQQASIAVKISTSQLLNSIGIPIALAYISGSRSDVQHPIFGNAGLVNNVFYLGLFSLLTPIWRFFDPFNLFLFVKKYYYNGVNRRLQMYGQKELNQHYAAYEMDLGYEYAYIIKTVIFTAFFMPLQPIIALFAPIGLGLIYAVNKYKLYYRFHRPKFHTFLVNDILDWVLALGPIAFALGQIYTFIWVNQALVQNTTIQVIGWVGLGIAGVLFLLPRRCFYCCINEPQMPNWDFFEKKAVIPTDFDMLNPVTKQQAIGQLKYYFQELENKKQLPDKSLMIQRSVIFNSKMNEDRRMTGSMRQAPIYVTNLNSYDNLLR